MTLPPKERIQHQAEVSLNWKGTCDILPSIIKPTLIIRMMSHHHQQILSY